MVFESRKPDKTEYIVPPPSEYKIKKRIENKRKKSDVKKTRSIKWTRNDYIIY